MSALNRKVLVLNKHWTPIRVVNASRAICIVMKGKADIINHDGSFQVHNWNEWESLNVTEGQSYIMTTRGKICQPEIILLSAYDRVPNFTPKLNKSNIYRRDNGQCQYTGQHLSKHEATIDHVVPRSKGGKNTWENLVICSPDVNKQKGSLLLGETDLTLKTSPTKPKWRVPSLLLPHEYPDSWKNFLPER